MHEAYVFLYIGSGRSLQSSTALLEIIDDGKAGDKPSTVNQKCPSTGLVPKVTTSAVDDGKAGDKPSTVNQWW